MRWPWHRRRAHVVLVVSGIGVVLEPWETTHMTASPIVGQTLPLSIAFLDQHGNPMPSTPDAPPAWTNIVPALETVTAAPDGLTATALALAPGDDTIDLDLKVGGLAFHASLAVTIIPAAQVLTSVAIVAGTPA